MENRRVSCELFNILFKDYVGLIDSQLRTSRWMIIDLHHHCRAIERGCILVWKACERVDYNADCGLGYCCINRTAGVTRGR